MKKCDTAGFSLIELMIVVGLIAVIGGMTVPAVMAGMRQYSLISATQQVASTIRAARFQAVGKNVRLRVRFNCPAADQYRIVEVTGDAGIDDAANRCDLAAYPFPAPDLDPLTLPNLDGAVQYLPDGADFGAVSGSIQIDSQGRVTALAGALPATIVVTNRGQNRMIEYPREGELSCPDRLRGNRSEGGFSLVEVLICTLILTTGLVAIAGMLAVTTQMHMGARESARSTRLAQSKIDELMNLDLDVDPKVAVGGNLDANTDNHWETLLDGITVRWLVAMGPTADTRVLTVRVVNMRAQQYRQTNLATIIRQ